MLSYLGGKRGRITLDFNKEILFGELGALIGTQLFGHLAFGLGYKNIVIAMFVIFGGLIGMAVFWLGARIYNQKKQNIFSKRKLIKDITYFTPMATIVSWGVYQPILFLLSKYFLEKGFCVSFAILFSQILAFMSFLIWMNLLRLFLVKTSGREL